MRHISLWTIAALLGVSWSHAAALERSARPFPADGPDPWRAGETVTIAYFNICTGWGWTWEIPLGERLAVVFEPGGTGGALESTEIISYVGLTPGYGFTGTIAVSAVDENDCPGATIAAQPYLPYGSWYTHDWSSLPVPSRFALWFRNQPGGRNEVPSYWTEHPAAGPTGPPACGSCFPTTRVTHSFSWGFGDGASCTPVRFHDDACDAELVVRAHLAIAPTSIANRSWGAIRELYR